MKDTYFLSTERQNRHLLKVVLQVTHGGCFLKLCGVLQLRSTYGDSDKKCTGKWMRQCAPVTACIHLKARLFPWLRLLGSSVLMMTRGELSVCEMGSAGVYRAATQRALRRRSHRGKRHPFDLKEETQIWTSLCNITSNQSRIIKCLSCWNKKNM